MNYYLLVTTNQTTNMAFGAFTFDRLFITEDQDACAGAPLLVNLNVLDCELL